MNDNITSIDAQPIVEALRQTLLQQLQQQPGLQIHESHSSATVAALDAALERAVELGLSFFYAVDGGVTELVNLQALEQEELTDG